MSAIDLSDVKIGTYVKIDGNNCKFVSVDGVKVWEYKPSNVFYDGNPDDILGKEAEINGYGFSGSSWTNFTISNVGEANSLIKPSGSYSYPVGQNTLSMRDGEYFLTMNINMSESPSGKNTSTFSNTVTFKQTYKKVIVPYDIWYNSKSGISELNLTIKFGTTFESIDCNNATSGAVELESTTASDKVIFEWNAYGSLTATRAIDDLFLVVDNIDAYV